MIATGGAGCACRRCTPLRHVTPLSAGKRAEMASHQAAAATWRYVAAGRAAFPWQAEEARHTVRECLTMARIYRQAAGQVLPMLALLTLGMLAGCAAGHVYTCRTDSECVAECVQAGETDCEVAP
jgi:hypothetical protein